MEGIGAELKFTNTKLEERKRAEREQLTLLKNACRAVLLFHQAGHWCSEDVQKWRKLTEREDVTTKVLCDTARKALQEGCESY